MFTLTYKESEKPTFVMPNGDEVAISCYHHVSDMMKRLRKLPIFQERGLKYMCVDEYSPVKGRPHYHGIIELGKLPGDTETTCYQLETWLWKTVLKEWRVNKAYLSYTDKNGKRKSRVNTRNPEWHDLCEYHEYWRNGKKHSTYDLHYIKPSFKEGFNDVSYYVTKYFFKDNPQDEKHLKHCVKACDNYEEGLQFYKSFFKTRCRKSLNFSGIWTRESYKEFLSTKNGLCLEYYPPVREHLDKCEAYSLRLKDGTYFVDIITNKAIPISKTLRKYLSTTVQLLYKDWLISTYGSVIDGPEKDNTFKHEQDEYFLYKQKLSDIFDDE